MNCHSQYEKDKRHRNDKILKFNSTMWTKRRLASRYRMNFGWTDSYLFAFKFLPRLKNCAMSDASGQINLRSIGVQNGSDSSFTIPGGDGWLYKYNPCYGFSFGLFDGLAVVQTTKSAGSVQDLGTQQSAFFNTSSQDTVSIHYTALDEARTSRVLLVCDAGVNTHTLQFVGELVVTEYDFLLETPCACPGVCNDDGIINPVGPKPPSDQGGINANVHNQANYGKSSYMWMGVGGSMTSFVFHDFFLVFLIAGIVLIIKYTGCISEKSNKSPSGFGPSDVTGGAMPEPKKNHSSIDNDSL